MNYTTKELLKIIPLDEDLRTSLLKEYDTYGESKKVEIDFTCIDIFSEMTEVLADIKFRQFLDEVQEGKRKLTTDLMDQAKEAVLQDYEDMLSGKKHEQEQIESIREKLQSLAKFAKVQTPAQSN